jgi:hypothetical protein
MLNENVLTMDLTKQPHRYFWNDIEVPFSHIKGCFFDRMIIIENIVLTEDE